MRVNKSGQIQQAANSLLLGREHLPDVNDKPISIPLTGTRLNR